MDSFYAEWELRELGIKKVGKSVLVSKKASLYGADVIEIGDYVRIDDFCILSGNIRIGSYIHISAYTSMYGGICGGIIMEDYTTISSRCAVYACSDDYSGDYMTNAVIPAKYKNVREEKVELKKYSIVGSGCTILPGVTIGEGAAVGAMSLVNRSLDEWGIYVGIPCRRMKERKKNLLDKVAVFEKNCRGLDKL